MIRIPKSIFSFGALFLAVGVLTLAVPRAAHAVAAALVQVNNTTANAAITQNVPSQAARLVFLSANLPPNTSSGFVTGNRVPRGKQHEWLLRRRCNCEHARLSDIQLARGEHTNEHI